MSVACCVAVPTPHTLHNASVYQDRRGHLRLNNNNNTPTALTTATTTTPTATLSHKQQQTPVQQQQQSHDHAELNHNSLSPLTVTQSNNQYMYVNGHQVLNSDAQRLAAPTANAYELQKQAEVKAQSSSEQRRLDADDQHSKYARVFDNSAFMFCLWQFLSST